MAKVGIGMVVSVEVKADRVDEFLKVMENDARRSRDKSIEPGNLRMDVLRVREDRNKFVFYEAYTDTAAVDHHKTTSHYKTWSEFKASGGIVSQTVAKFETTSLPDWAWQTESSGDKPTSSAVLVTVEIKKERLADFLKAMEVDAKKSREEPGCFRFDLVRSNDNPNMFMFYEAYADDAAVDHHRTTAHYKVWGDFKATGAVVNQTVTKLETASLPGTWAFQP